MLRPCVRACVIGLCAYVCANARARALVASVCGVVTFFTEASFLDFSSCFLAYVRAWDVDAWMQVMYVWVHVRARMRVWVPPGMARWHLDAAGAGEYRSRAGPGAGACAYVCVCIRWCDAHASARTHTHFMHAP